MITLRHMFPDSPGRFDFESIKPLTHDIFLREVLVPEVTVHLIQEDLSLSREEAMHVLQESHHFGNILHPTDDDSSHVEDAARRAMELSSNENAAHRLWKAAGTSLNLEEWVVEQEELEEALAVKQEEIDVDLEEPDFTASGAGVRGDPIDLTED